MKVAAVDLFCGAGGLSYGLQQSGISVVAGIDKDPDCKYPYEQNIDGEYVRADVHALAQDPEPIAQMYPWDADLKVLAACAPCQPYSTMGHSKAKGHEDHQKWGLLNEVSRIVEYVEPDVVVTENVLQVKQEDGVYDSFIESLESQGYHVNSDENKNVYCPEYGIPQKRKRWVVMASKRGPSLCPTHRYRTRTTTLRSKTRLVTCRQPKQGKSVTRRTYTEHVLSRKRTWSVSITWSPAEIDSLGGGGP